jgi:predicted TPR repeat methyltransferase
MSENNPTTSKIAVARQLLSTGQARQALKNLLAIHTDDIVIPDFWFTLGMAYAETGDLAKAEEAFSKTTQLDPNHISAFTNMGRALVAQGKTEQAIIPLEQAITITPSYLPAIIQLVDIFISIKRTNEAEKLCTEFIDGTGGNIEIIIRLGMIRNSQKRYAEAIELYDQALHINASSLKALMNKGFALKFSGKLNEAIEIFKQASMLAPKVQNVWHVLASAQETNHDMEEAISSFEKAFAINPNVINTANHLVKLYRYVGRVDESIEVCKQILNVQPDNIKARYYIDAYNKHKSNDIPDRLPVEIALNVYSGENVGKKFDVSLRHTLNYQSPKILDQAVREVVEIPVQGIDILELGCGSGLCGSLFKDISKKLVGTDISADMLVAAREKQAYDQLYAADLIDVLADTSSQYDLIIAMDVLCFFGGLTEIFEKCSAKLNDNGVFGFSVVKPDNEVDLELNNHGHFAHSPDYLNRISKQADFEKIYLKEIIQRREMGMDHYGYVCLFKKI